MKKEINGSEAVYLIAIFVMPIVTLIGITLLIQDVVNISNVIQVGDSDLSTILFDEIMLFIVCWISLFVSYILFKNKIKLAQYLLIIASLVFLLLNVYASMSKYASIADIINPLVLLSASSVAILKPAEDKKEEKKEEVKKEVKKKSTPVKKEITKEAKKTTKTVKKK